MIKQASPYEQYKMYEKSIHTAIKKVFSSGMYILGSEVKILSMNFQNI